MNLQKNGEIKGTNIYNTCQNILSFDFNGEKYKEFKTIMIKIVNHYLNGNRFSHLEYFINKK